MGMGKSKSIVVTTRKFSRHPQLRQRLTELFPEARFNDDGRKLVGDELVEFMRGADAAIVGLEPVTSSVLDALPSLQVIAKYGVGLDNVDVEHALKIGKRVAWRGGVNKRSVAELTLTFLLGLARNIFFSSFQLKRGEWCLTGGSQLSGKTVGIVGCGFCGTEVLKVLAPFGCRVLVHDIVDKQDVCREYGAEQVPFERLLGESDFVSLHTPLTKETRGLIGAEALGRMKPSAFLINTARGPVVSQAALKKALQENQIAGAALDVFEDEPPSDREFLSLPNLMVTPHIGGTSDEAIYAMGMCAIEGLVRELEEPQAPASR